jgi:hypothetical protein
MLHYPGFFFNQISFLPEIIAERFGVKDVREKIDAVIAYLFTAVENLSTCVYHVITIISQVT